jgi:hypothetical protein
MNSTTASPVRTGQASGNGSGRKSLRAPAGPLGLTRFDRQVGYAATSTLDESTASRVCS